MQSHMHINIQAHNSAVLLNKIENYITVVTITNTPKDRVSIARSMITKAAYNK
jgi:hypothetical protein